MFYVGRNIDVSVHCSSALKIYENTYKDFPLVQNVYRHLLDCFFCFNLNFIFSTTSIFA